MKNLKMALLAGAAVAVSAAAAHADELSDLKAQVETLNARVAAMETAPSVPAGYQLLAISKGEALQVPGLGSSDDDRVQNTRATIISVMPTADAPAGTTVSWSGYVRAAIVYTGNSGSTDKTLYNLTEDGWVKDTKTRVKNYDLKDWDVKSRGQLKVVATTDTAVGEVGVELNMRADFNGVAGANSDVYLHTAWGYWSMTPELTLGGGFSGSLGNVGYGYDGACTCYYTDNADVGFNPGDTTQMRLSYASGPFSMAVALEDAGTGTNGSNDNFKASYNQLGGSGEIKYSGDSFSGEISGVYRATGDAADKDGKAVPTYGKNVDGLWQVGAGVGFNLGDMASLSLGAATGAGPFELVNSDGQVDGGLPIYNQWWGVSGLASVKMSDAVHAEVGAGYKSRSGDNSTLTVTGAGKEFIPGTYDVNGIDYETYSFLGGLYYTPVDQLTIGIEGEWYNTQWNTTATKRPDLSDDAAYKVNSDVDNYSVDLVSVWRF